MSEQCAKCRQWKMQKVMVRCGFCGKPICVSCSVHHQHNKRSLWRREQ